MQRASIVRRRTPIVRHLRISPSHNVGLCRSSLLKLLLYEELGFHERGSELRNRSKWSGPTGFMKQRGRHATPRDKIRL